MFKFSLFFTLFMTATGMVQAQLDGDLDPAIDPTGNLARLLDLEASCAAQKQEIVAGIRFDYHPDYGTITADQYPVHEGGWQAENVHEQLGANAAEITNFKVIDSTYTGVALVQHKIGEDIVYVWHQYKDEPVVLVAFEDQSDPDDPFHLAFSLYGCGNGGIVLDPKFDWYLIGQLLGRW